MERLSIKNSGNFGQSSVLKKSHLKVPTDLKVLERVLSHFNRIERSFIPKKDWLKCQLALAEGFTNAVRHAHKHLSSEIPIEIDLTLFKSAMELRIWDYGPPFDLEAYLKNMSSLENQRSEGGRGILILKKIADRLSYFRTDDNRNCLLVVKQFAPLNSHRLNDPSSQAGESIDAEPLEIASNSGQVVCAKWLASQLDNPQIAIVDCRFLLSDPQWGYRQYANSHIPGAYYLDLDKDLSSRVERHGGRHPLPKPEVIAEKLAAIGAIDNETLIVAYDSSRFAFAARLWWLLRYLGHDRVALLDGGWTGWEAGGYPVSNTISTPNRKGKFSPQPRLDWVVDIDALKAKKDSPRVALIDSREAERYRGEIEPIDPIGGHIPGALNSPWKRVTDERGFLLPPIALQQLWNDYRDSEEIVVYCGSGVTACVNLFSLELAGFKNAKLYPGGWSDWCSYLPLK